MTLNDTGPAYFLRVPPDTPSGEVRKSFLGEKAEEKEAQDDHYILCRRCFHKLTHPGQRIEVQGAHHHIFANPQGIIFEIGCYRSAEGCGYAGFATEEFSWFKGFGWRIAVCGACLTHVGWFFSASGKPSFNGLILNRLTGPA